MSSPLGNDPALPRSEVRGSHRCSVSSVKWAWKRQWTSPEQYPPWNVKNKFYQRSLVAPSKKEVEGKKAWHQKIRSILNSPTDFSVSWCNELPHGCGGQAMTCARHAKWCVSVNHGPFLCLKKHSLQIMAESAKRGGRKHLPLWQTCGLSHMSRNVISHTHITPSRRWNLWWRHSQLSYRF